MKTGVDLSTLYRTRSRGADLWHRDGVKVLALWCRITGRAETDAPRRAVRDPWA